MALAALCWTHQPTLLAEVYNAASDYSIVKGNPNGVWTYGYRLTTLGTDLTVFPAASTGGNGLQYWYDPGYSVLGTPGFAYNPGPDPVGAAGMTWPPGRLSFHPSPIHDTVLRFTAPRTAEWDVSATFLGMDGGTTNVLVVRDGAAVLFSSARSGIGGNAGPFVAHVSLARNQTLEFVVNNAGSFYYDTTGLEVVISGAHCTADVVGIGGAPPPDGLLTGDDFIAFINGFVSGDPVADITGIGGPPELPDGLITGDDFITFVNAFAAGCP